MQVYMYIINETRVMEAVHTSICKYMLKGGDERE